MKKFPKKLKIGGHTYKVIFPYIFKERTDVYGQTDRAVNEIRINDKDFGGNSFPESRLNEIMWHEILHAINGVYNSDKLEEDTITRLAEGLNQVLIDNFEIRIKRRGNEK